MLGWKTAWTEVIFRWYSRLNEHTWEGWHHTAWSFSCIPLGSFSGFVIWWRLCTRLLSVVGRRGSIYFLGAVSPPPPPPSPSMYAFILPCFQGRGGCMFKVKPLPLHFWVYLLSLHLIQGSVVIPFGIKPYHSSGTFALYTQQEIPSKESVLLAFFCTCLSWKLVTCLGSVQEWGKLDFGTEEPFFLYKNNSTMALG